LVSDFVRVWWREQQDVVIAGVGEMAALEQDRSGAERLRTKEREAVMRVVDLQEELVVLLDESGRSIGTAPKRTMHDTDTALHLAFSVYVFNNRGDVLVTRRALGKKTWPGVWTNSFCGHPLPDEPQRNAITRRGRHELGVDVKDLTVTLPLFRYRATDASGIVENEICPVYRATVSTEPVPNPDEVAEYAWTDPATLRASVLASPWAFSPWMVLQLKELRFDA
jgi:isopentenyl-diphosphate delta-isomerase